MKHAWLVVAVLFLGWANLGYTAEPEKAAAKKESKKGEAERLWPRGPKIEDLKTELGLTDDQIAKMKEALAPLQKKNDELESKADVKAAEEAVEKAKAALKAAEGKHTAAKDNFDLLTERKKAVYSLIPEDKRAKAQDVLHYKPEKEKTAAAKEKKSDAGGDKK
jgi:DNA repair exonuclease SbcCD ATPase subunit